MYCPKCGNEMEEVSKNGFSCKYCAEKENNKTTEKSKILEVLKIISLIWFGLIFLIYLSEGSTNEFFLNLFMILLVGGLPYIIIKAIIRHKNELQKNVLKKSKVIPAYMCLLLVSFIGLCCNIDDNEIQTTNTANLNMEVVNQIENEALIEDKVETKKSDKELYDELSIKIGNIVDQSKQPMLNSITKFPEDSPLEKELNSSYTGYFTFFNDKIKQIDIYTFLKNDEICEIYLQVFVGGMATETYVNYSTGRTLPINTVEGDSVVVFKIDNNDYSKLIKYSEAYGIRKNNQTNSIYKDNIDWTLREKIRDYDYLSVEYSFETNNVTSVWFKRDGKVIDLSTLN